MKTQRAQSRNELQKERRQHIKNYQLDYHIYIQISN
jgi:hypothetical protein